MQDSFVGYIQRMVICPEWKKQGFGRNIINFFGKRIFTESPKVFICISSFNDFIIPIF